jgi:hypothetical protein
MQQLCAAQAAAPRCRAPLRRGARRAAACSASAATPPSSPPTPGALSVTLRRPLGIVFAERKMGAAEGVFVEELVPGGNAQKAGVSPGDVLLRVSATLLKSGKEGQFEAEGYGQRPFDNWDRVMVPAENMDFDTVMNAISSNNERWGIMDVVLEFQRAGGAPAASAAAPAVAQAAPAAPAVSPAAAKAAAREAAAALAASTLVEVEVLLPAGGSTKARHWRSRHTASLRATSPAPTATTASLHAWRSLRASAPRIRRASALTPVLLACI